MRRKELWLGFMLGIAANGIGMALYMMVFSKLGILETLRIAYKEGFMGSLVALGAVGNLIAFFWFIRQRQDSRARGVVAATLLAALLVLLYKMFL